MRYANWPFFPSVNLRQTALSRGLCLAVGSISGLASAQAIPTPGSLITNVASGDFVDRFGNTQIINSNPVELRVTEVRALQLVRDQEQIGLMGGQMSYPHTLTNTGNVADSYTLSVDQPNTDDFNLLGLAVYIDRNQDGIPDDNINLLLAGNQLALQPGESIALVAAGTIPTNQQATNRADFSLTATSQAPTAPPSATVTDITRVTEGGVLTVNKSQSLSTGALGSVITYTLRYSNTGNAAAELRLTDLLDANRLNYIAGSARWSNSSVALTDGVSEDPANSAISDYLVNSTASQHAISVVIPSVPAQSTGSISFQVQVIAAPNGKVNNTATYQQLDGVTTVKNTSTNTVTFTVQGNVGVVLNNSGSPVNVGDPNAAPDNLVLVASAVAGVETLFDNYVWNTGDQVDNFNLSFVPTNLPTCATVRLYAADGKTLLTDSNADGLIDTGAMRPNSSKNIKVGISSTQDCAIASSVLVDLTATSSNNPTISDPIRNQLDMIVQGTTDLYNSDNSGLGNPNPTAAGGAAFITKPILPAGTAVFPLVVKNTGTLINNYALIADADGVLDPINNSNQLSAGWSVEFFSQLDPACATLGDKITDSGPVAANGTFAYCAVVTAPAGAAPQDFPVWFAVRSTLNGQTDILKDQVQVQAARLLTLQADNQGQVSIGGTVVYTHTLTNIGNVTEGTTVGDVLLSLDISNANGMLVTLYYDANDNGVLDSTDPQATDVAALGSTNAAIGLAPNESIRLLVKVNAPTTLTNGSTSNVVLTATPVGLIAGMAAAPISNTDVTVVSANQVRLQKMQALDADCDGIPTAYSVAALEIAPTQCVFYQITATNDGATSVNNVVISDRIPAYTRLFGTPTVTPQGTLLQPTAPFSNGYQGDVQADLGTLPPSQSATLNFAIRVDPVN